MLLSQLLSSKRLPFQHIISISTPQQSLIIDNLPVQFCTRIKQLSLTHCQLKTLAGLQQFPNLQILNLKYNDIRDYQQLKIVTCRKTLQQLVLTGNDIEHFHQCRFIQLKKTLFPKLRSLNGHDYIISQKNKKKSPKKMQQIISSVAKMTKQMKSNLKKCIYQDQINMIKRHSNNFYQQQSQKSLARESQEEEEENIVTKRKQTSQQANHSKFQQQEHNKQNLAQDIFSLSNIMMAKSMRQSQDNALMPNRNKNKQKLRLSHLDQSNVKKSTQQRPLACLQLNISTSQQNMQNHLPIAQPTATFAKQKHFQQNNLPLNFKSRNSKAYQKTEPQIWQQEDATDRTQQKMGASFHSQISQIRIDQEKQEISALFFETNLLQKCFWNWRSVIGMRSQMPKKSILF